MPMNAELKTYLDYFRNAFDARGIEITETHESSIFCSTQYSPELTLTCKQTSHNQTQAEKEEAEHEQPVPLVFFITKRPPNTFEAKEHGLFNFTLRKNNGEPLLRISLAQGAFDCDYATLAAPFVTIAHKLLYPNQ